MAYRGNTSNVPCKYFQQGNCKWGNSCKYAHVYANNNGTKQDQGNRLTEEEYYRSFIDASSLPKIQKTILSDLTEAGELQEKPLSSAYGYGLPCAVNLINDRDVSPEELRLKYYEARQKGTLGQYEAEVVARENDMQKCFAHIRSHPDLAARYLQICTKEIKETGVTTMKSGFINFPVNLTGQSGFGGAAGSSSFGNNPFTQARSTFGSTNAFGSTGTGAFGQTSSSGSKGAFGFGAATSNGLDGTSAYTAGQSGGVFGQPTFSGLSAKPKPGAIRPNNSSAFGAAAPTQPMGTGSVFGQPQFGAGPAAGSTTTAFGVSNFGGSTFGQTAFGSSTNFGSAPNAANSSGTSTASPFGSMQNNNGATVSPFGSLQNKPAGLTASPFGSIQNNQSSTSSPFGAMQNGSNSTATTSTTSTGPFSQLANNSSSPFAKLNSTGSAGSQSTAQPGFNKPTTAFGTPFGAQATGAGSAPSVFGKPTTDGATNAFGLGFSSNPAGSALQSGISGAPKFLQGIPPKDSTMNPDDLDKQTLQQFEAASFALGKVPDIPPPMALIS